MFRHGTAEESKAKTLVHRYSGANYVQYVLAYGAVKSLYKEENSNCIPTSN